MMSDFVYLGPYAQLTGAAPSNWEALLKDEMVVKTLWPNTLRRQTVDHEGTVVLISNRKIPGLTQHIQFEANAGLDRIFSIDSLQQQLDVGKFYSFHKRILDSLSSYKLEFGLLVFEL
jgi:hypothetical protein